MSRIFNFNAGPAALPLEVLEEVQAELLDFANTGMSILEISHRSPAFEKVLAETKQDIADLLQLPDDYGIFFMAGGGSLQFSCVPYNFLTAGKIAAYADTGSFSDKAYQEAEKVGSAVKVFSSKAQGYDRVPRPEEVALPENCAYLHITGNNTIEGTEYFAYPETGDVPLIADMSSEILSRPFPVEKFSLIYSGVQKNIGPAGAVLVIARKDFVAGRDKKLPVMMNYETMLEKDSLYNTPPVFAIYIVGKVAKWLKKQGGLTAMEAVNRKKAGLLYDILDKYPEFYRGRAEKASRSIMNVTFNLPSKELEAKFAEAGKQRGLGGLKGHRSVGGIRASIYNAMPLAGCEALAQFMEEFYEKNK
ncbi:MAG: 3-phosphoserine/phosphohydroxythreonine transaminase [Acidaminococcaceae bacterium]|nr:3-phosphoserine/phosphohydroxythreonine transaminase [Acidaminococcaceae bacterium]